MIYSDKLIKQLVIAVVVRGKQIITCEHWLCFIKSVVENVVLLKVTGFDKSGQILFNG